MDLSSSKFFSIFRMCSRYINCILHYHVIMQLSAKISRNFNKYVI